MNYRMLAVDLDGTLFDSSGTVPQCHVEAMQRAKDAGMMVVLGTGRGLNEARPAIDQLQHDGPVVLANGALVSDPATGKTLHRMSLEPHMAMEIVELLDNGRDAVLVLMDPEPTGLDYLVKHCDRMTANTRWWFSAIDAKLACVKDVTVDDLHHALRVGIVGPSHHMPEVVERLKAKFGDRIFVQHFMAVKQDEEDVHVLEVFTTGVSKWSGLRWLAGLHDIEQQQIVAIGDEINDLQMIEGAGCGIAMGNAVPAVAAVANRQTGTNDAGGVAQAVNHLLAGDW